MTFCYLSLSLSLSLSPSTDGPLVCLFSSMWERMLCQTPAGKHFSGQILSLSSNLSFSFSHLFTLSLVTRNTCSRYNVTIITSTLQWWKWWKEETHSAIEHSSSNHTYFQLLPNLMEMSLISYLHWRLRALLPSLNKYFSLFEMELLPYHETQTK